MDEAPGSLGALRRLNRLRVLDTLRRRGSVSRADIARQTGLSRTTVSNLVGDLLAEGVVVEQATEDRPSASPNGGRPPTLLTLDPSAGAVVGIDFGHDEVRVAVADLAYTLLSETSCALDVDHRAEDALSSAAAMVERMLEEAGRDRRRLFGAGVALSAPVRAGTRALASPAIIPDWTDRNVSDELGRRLGTPVYVGNDANLGALAEATFEIGRAS